MNIDIDIVDKLDKGVRKTYVRRAWADECSAILE